MERHCLLGTPLIDRRVFCGLAYYTVIIDDRKARGAI